MPYILQRPRRIPLPRQMARIRSSLPRSIRPAFEIDSEVDMVALTRDVHPFALRAVWHGFVVVDIASTACPACSECSLAPGFGHPGCIILKEIILG
jgi:hypothetical protein